MYVLGTIVGIIASSMAIMAYRFHKAKGTMKP